MIDTLQHQALQARRLWSGTIRQQFRCLELEDRPSAQEVSESLAVFCQSCRSLSGSSLALLMARSFCAAGDWEAAARILQHDQAWRGCADSRLSMLSSEYPFPELYPLFSSRALHPLHLHAASGGTAWVLDFSRVQLTDADRCELILFRTLRALIEKTSCVWHASAGSGTLALKGLRCLERPRAARHPRSASRFLEYIADVLSQQAAKAGWSDTPDILCLDF